MHNSSITYFASYVFFTNFNSFPKYGSDKKCFLLHSDSAFDGIHETRNPQLSSLGFADERIHDRIRIPRSDVTSATSLRIPDSKVYRTRKIGQGIELTFKSTLRSEGIVPESVLSRHLLFYDTKI